jgi:hypothetical protein
MPARQETADAIKLGDVRIRDKLPISHGHMVVRKCRNRHRLPVCARVNPPDGGRQPQKPGESRL